MTKIKIRLEYNHVFPDLKEKKEVLEYLKEISRFSLENIIGYFTTSPLPNFDKFFSNENLRNQIIDKVIIYSRKNNIKEKPEIISIEGSLIISELILANKNELILENILTEDKDRDELNLFKAFLVVNESLNKSKNLTLDSTIVNIDKIAEMMVSLKFSSSDFGVYENADVELLQLSYVTSYKFAELLKFLESDDGYKYLREELCKYFKQSNVDNLKKQVDYLLVQILLFRKNNSYKFLVEDSDTIEFFNSLISDQIIADEDFINIRNFPLYKIGNDTFSIINPFFVLDKFTKSVKFLLKECFNNHHNLQSNDRTFFSFYNNLFSEKFLMKNVLENIFSKKQFSKQEILVSDDKEPDYYIRHNKDIYIFEYKDVLFPKNIKSSGDIEKITKMLKGKFLVNPTTDKRIGIGQIINNIEAISNNSFAYDNNIILGKFYNIYPILLLSDRTLEIPGMNHIFNNWFKSNLNDINKNLTVKNLIIMDIDTLIFYQEYLKSKDKNFKNILDMHNDSMKMSIKGYGKNLLEFENNVNKKITKKLTPFSNKFSNDMFEIKKFVDRFAYLVSEI